MRNYFSKRLFATFFVLATAAISHGGLLPTEVTTKAEGSTYRYNYKVTLTSDLELHPGDFFTIYDFAGFVPGSNTQPANFTFSSLPLGPTPPNVLPNDSAAIENLTWTYNGPVTTIGQNQLGNFTASSIFSSSTENSFTARTHRVSDGVADSNITDTTVPGPCGPQVPEPGTLLLIAAGLPVIGAARWAKKRRENAAQS